MGEPEFLDFPFRGGQRAEPKNRDDYNLMEDEEFFNPARSRVSDYKHSSNAIHKGSAAAENRFEPRHSIEKDVEKKNYINLSDEKIVWVGAIFVFFGVLIFLIGYWLGKTTIKDITQNTATYSRQIEERLNQKKIENEMGRTQTPSLVDNSKLNPTPISQEASKKGVVTPQLPAETTTPKATVAPIQKSTETKTEPKAMVRELKPTEKKSEPEVRKPVESAPTSGNFTLQVSAHTSIEKARFVEDSLRTMGFQAYLVEATVNGTTYYRVRAGKFQTKGEAESAMTRLKNSEVGKDSFIVSIN